MKDELLMQTYVALHTGNIEASKNTEFIQLYTNNYNEIEKLEEILLEKSKEEVELHKDIVSTVSNIKIKFDFKKLEEEVVEKVKEEIHVISNSLKAVGIDLSDKNQVLENLKQHGVVIPNLTVDEIKPYRENSLVNKIYIALKDEIEVKRFESLKKYSNIDGEIRPQFYLYGSLSGRIISHSPNIQGLPGEYKKYLLPLKKGDSVYELDVRCAELLALAFIANEQIIFEKLSQGKDPYAWLFSQIFPKTEIEITEDIRKMVKALVNGINLGMGDEAIKNRVNKEAFITKKIDIFQARKIKENYLQNVPAISMYLEEIKNANILQTALGFEILGIKPSYKNLSFPGQNLISTLLKLSLCDLRDAHRDKIINLVHDSLWVSCNEEEMLEIKNVLEQIFSQMLPKEFLDKSILLIRAKKIKGAESCD